MTNKFYHIIMQKKASLINKLLNSGYVTTKRNDKIGELILMTDNPEECQKAVGDYKLVFADPDNYSNTFSV